MNLNGEGPLDYCGNGTFLNKRSAKTIMIGTCQNSQDLCLLNNLIRKEIKIYGWVGGMVGGTPTTRKVSA